GVSDHSLISSVMHFVVFFFFQAEDGIRDRNVTGVQTCALPIFEHATKPVVKVIPVNLDDVNLDLEAQLEALAPFGTDNPRPVFEFKDYKVNTVQAIGQQKNHLK